MQLAILQQRSTERSSARVQFGLNSIPALPESRGQRNANQSCKQNRDHRRIGKADSRRTQSDKLGRVRLDASNDARATPEDRTRDWKSHPFQSPRRSLASGDNCPKPDGPEAERKAVVLNQRRDRRNQKAKRHNDATREGHAGSSVGRQLMLRPGERRSDGARAA